MLSKSSGTAFKIIFDTLISLGACHLIIIGVVVYKKSMTLEVFLEYLSKFSTFPYGIIFGSKIYRVIGALVTLETSLKVPTGPFLTILCNF